MSVVIGIVLAAVLFAAFALVRPKKASCGGNCGTCDTGSCSLPESKHEQS
jgi:hypothetical protein